MFNSTEVYDWSLDVEHNGQFRDDAGHISEDPDSDIENLRNKNIRSSAGNLTINIGIQTDPIGKEALRQERWIRMRKSRNNPAGWDPAQFLREDPPVRDSDPEEEVRIFSDIK